MDAKAVDQYLAEVEKGVTALQAAISTRKDAWA